ncbi:MAG: lipoprotein-releasing ABC transporter permease subunit [Deltaproteobacteria bacterium]|nr:lipoprotein-releasing ABC transporter permease subunit [Deltaproteobacteria bacterium]
MRFPYELGIALRYLKAGRRELFISLITWISVGGVALGVAALIVVLSVMTGFEEDLRDKILGTNAHVVVSPMGSLLAGPAEVVRKVQAVPGVVGATPFALSQVMISAGGNVQGAVLRGIDVATAAKVIDIERFLRLGRLRDLEGDVPGLLLGREMARNMGIFVGDRVQVISPVGNATPLGMIPRIRSFRVVGIFASGMYEYDTTFLFASLPAAQDFLRLGRTVTGVEVRVADIYSARRIARAVESRLGAGYFARDWMEMNRSLFSALKLEKTVMFVILALIVLVAAFNIASTLIMVVLEKSREIGILKSMGASNRSIRKIFVLEGLIIGGLGTTVGVLGGWVLCFLLKKYRFVELPRDVYYIDTLPVVMSPTLFALVAFCAVALCLAATAYPSWQASRLDPVATLRYE